MADIVFDQDQSTVSTAQPSIPGGMIGFLIKKGLARTTKQANIILIGIAVVCFSLAIILPWIL